MDMGVRFRVAACVYITLQCNVTDDDDDDDRWDASVYIIFWFLSMLYRSLCGICQPPRAVTDRIRGRAAARRSRARRVYCPNVYGREVCVWHVKWMHMFGRVS